MGGSGDAFLVFGLLGAFRTQHPTLAPKIVLRPRLAAVGDLWGIPYEIDAPLVERAERDHGFHTTYPNEFGTEAPYYVHPCFIRSPVRIDKLTTRPDASQADMYRMLLRLPFDAPLTPLPEASRRSPVPVNSRAVVIITDSTSWPNTQPGFWAMLVARLIRDGWQVHVNDKSESLGTLLDRCRRASWVIGPQCGVMSILVTGEFACRKTLATPNIDGNRRPEYLAAETFPYGYVTKFANADYDVEEFKISDGNHADLVERIATGVNARGRPHDPRPVMTVMCPLSPGEFFDKLAVLHVKHQRFTPERRAAIEREYQRLSEVYRQLGVPSGVDELYGRLVDLHGRCYDLLAKVVPAAIGDGGIAPEDHVEAIRANKVRIEIKAAIDAMCHAPYGEVKDYYPSNGGDHGLRCGIQTNESIPGQVRTDA